MNNKSLVIEGVISSCRKSLGYKTYGNAQIEAANVFFENLTPLDSFREVDALGYVNALRTKSRSVKSSTEA
jgi:hypothetical protein